MDYTYKAAAAAGGDRAAYIAGWQTMESRGALFRNMKRYDGEAQASFIKGFHDCDDALGLVT